MSRQRVVHALYRRRATRAFTSHHQEHEFEALGADEGVAIRRRAERRAQRVETILQPFLFGVVRRVASLERRHRAEENVHAVRLAETRAVRLRRLHEDRERLRGVEFVIVRGALAGRALEQPTHQATVGAFAKLVSRLRANLHRVLHDADGGVHRGRLLGRLLGAEPRERLDDELESRVRRDGLDERGAALLVGLHRVRVRELVEELDGVGGDVWIIVREEA